MKNIAAVLLITLTGCTQSKPALVQTTQASCITDENKIDLFISIAELYGGSLGVFQMADADLPTGTPTTVANAIHSEGKFHACMVLERADKDAGGTGFPSDYVNSQKAMSKLREYCSHVK